MQEIRKCEYCQNEFIATRSNAKFCSAACRYYGTLKQEKKKRSDSPPSKKDTSQTFVEIAVAARKAGMSYGKYVAKMGL